MNETLHPIITQLEKQKKLAESTFDQLTDEEFFFKPNRTSNSVAVIVKHISGNIRSRWTNVFTEDGEKPDRNRPKEFDETGNTRPELIKYWKEQWDMFLKFLHSLNEEDLERIIYIRKQPHSLLEAIVRQLVHYSHHTGQIVYLGKMIKAEEWKNQSIPTESEIFDYREI